MISCLGRGEGRQPHGRRSAETYAKMKELGPVGVWAPPGSTNVQEYSPCNSH